MAWRLWYACDSGDKWTKGDAGEGLNALVGGVWRLIGVSRFSMAVCDDRIAPRLGVWNVYFLGWCM